MKSLNYDAIIEKLWEKFGRLRYYCKIFSKGMIGKRIDHALHKIIIVTEMLAWIAYFDVYISNLVLASYTV